MSVLKVGVTGGIGSGKSLICRIFGILDIPVYDADSRAKWLMHNDRELMRSVKDLIGEQSYQNGQLNRQYVASRTFGNPELLEKLNALVHPAVRRDYESWHNDQTTPYTIKEAALLVETGSYRELDFLINVNAPENIRINRIRKRDPQRSEQQIMDIISRQLSDADRMEKADFTIVNDDSNLVIPQVISIDNRLRSL